MTWKVTEHMIFLLSLAVICSFSHCEGTQGEGAWWGQRIFKASSQNNTVLKSSHTVGIEQLAPFSGWACWAKYLMASIRRLWSRSNPTYRSLASVIREVKWPTAPRRTQRPAALSQYIFRMRAEPCKAKKKNKKRKFNTRGVTSFLYRSCARRRNGASAGSPRAAAVAAARDETQASFDKHFTPRPPSHHKFPPPAHTRDTNSAFASGIQKLLTAEHLFKAFCAANEGWRNFN